MSSFASILEQFERTDLAEKPLFAALAKEDPVNLAAIWVLPANLARVHSTGLIPWLASAIARCPDDRIRCIVVRQLFDELGEGHHDRCHPLLLDRLIQGLDPYRPANVTDATFAPARNLHRNLGRYFSADNPYEAIIAIMVIEIFAVKFDTFLGPQIRRQGLLDAESMRWVTLHERLEVGHAADSRVLAELVGASGMSLQAIEQHAVGIWNVMTGFLDDVYAACVEAGCLAAPTHGREARSARA